MNQLLVPTANAGEFVIPALGGKTVKLVEWREGAFYDTIETAASPSAGATYYVFRDISNKNLAHTNLKTPRKIPDGAELVMSKIGVLPNQALANTLLKDEDLIKFVYAFVLEFKLGTRLIAEGPLYYFASGFGVTGNTTRADTGIATIGVASTASVTQLLVAQSVTNKTDLDATYKLEDNSWITGGSSMPTFSNRIGVTTIAHGLIKRAQGS